MKFIKYFFNTKSNFTSNSPLKIFSFLITSTVIVHLSGWALVWKFGEDLYPLSNRLVTHSQLFSPGRDGSYFEYYQYILLCWCFILSIRWVFKNKYWKALSIPLTYLFLFFDDSLMLHDRFFNNLINNFSSDINFLIDKSIYIRDFAEWIYWPIIFIIIILFSLPGILSKNEEINKFILKNYILFFLLAFFGLFIDLISANIYQWILIESEIFVFILRVFFHILEEVGEICVIAFACIWLFNLNFSK